MTEENPDRRTVDRFIGDHIDSVPHIEALLLLWRQPFEYWTVENVAKRLWIKAEDATTILQDLVRDHLIISVAGKGYQYQSGPDNDRLLNAVDRTYRSEMIRIATMIHSKPSPAVRAFARAFRFTKEKD